MYCSCYVPSPYALFACFPCLKADPENSANQFYRVKPMTRTNCSGSTMEPTSLSEVGLQVCIELEKQRKHGFEQQRWDRTVALIRTLLSEEVCATNELRYLLNPTYSSDAPSLAFDTYHARLNQVSSAMTAISGNPSGASSQALQNIIEACWQIHRLLLQARGARLSGDY